ncbi:MAG: hypothetical protein ACRDD7_04690 [Peptostreptococcaceae bacterium]
MKRCISDFMELKCLSDYYVIRKIVQSNKSYNEKVSELKGYATPDSFNWIMKHFARISLDV